MLELEDLADEIFLEIFSHLSAERACACLLSRRLGALAQYVLYRSPFFVDKESLEWFLCTILSRPNLAKFVRDLTLDIRTFRPEPSFNPCDIPLFAATASRLELPYSMERSDHQFQLLLHLLQNLQVLDLTREATDQFDQFLENSVIHDGARPLPAGFRSLRHVHLP